MGVFGGKLRDLAAEGGALLHTFINEIDAVAVLTLHTFEQWSHLIFFTDILFRPLNGNAVLECKGFDPGLILIGPLPQNFLSHGSNANDLPKKIDHVFWS